MTSQTAYKEFIKLVLKEEKVKLSKSEIEELYLETYTHAFDEVLNGVHDVQTDFVC